MRLIFLDKAGHKSRLRRANDETDDSPTPSQVEAGNYRKGKLSLHGLTVTIETPAGGVRSGVSPDGEKWECKLEDAYGYINRTSGADGDHVDCFVGPDPKSEVVFVVDQVDKDGDWDEHKVILGCSTEAKAREVYLRNYEPGWKGLAAITPLTIPAFKAWLFNPLWSVLPLSAVNAPVKMTKVDVHYREGLPGHNCGNCTMYRCVRRIGICTAVAGIIKSDDVCDLWEGGHESVPNP